MWASLSNVALVEVRQAREIVMGGGGWELMGGRGGWELMGGRVSLAAAPASAPDGDLSELAVNIAGSRLSKPSKLNPAGVAGMVVTELLLPAASGIGGKDCPLPASTTVAETAVAGALSRLRRDTAQASGTKCCEGRLRGIGRPSESQTGLTINSCLIR